MTRKSERIITPKEFEAEMREITKDDPETAHINADDLMLNLLTQLGYGDGVKIFENMERWYS